MARESIYEAKIASRPEPSVDHAAVEAMAYQLWLQRGCPAGSDQEDWYRAEAELYDALAGPVAWSQTVSSDAMRAGPAPQLAGEATPRHLRHGS